MTPDELLIEVCSRDEAGEILSSPEREGLLLLISIADEGLEPPTGYDLVENKIRLLFLDRDDEMGPRDEHVRQIIDVAQSLAGKAGRVLVHCLAGISRSTATAVILRGVILGPGRERDAVAAVFAQRPKAWPNRRMIAIADRLLGREGRLVSAVADALYGDNIFGKRWYALVSGA